MKEGMQVRKLRSREYCQELKNSRIEVSSLGSRRFAPDTSHIIPLTSHIRYELVDLQLN